MREKYLELLSEQFPTEEEIVTEIINLEAILNLPKATEHFVSDLHGEYDAFDHVLRNGSGNVKVKIKALYEDKLSEHELQELITLVYYPEEKIIDYKRIHRKLDDLHQWYSTTLTRLVEITTYCASKYTRSKVRKSLPERFAYIMEELLYNLDNTIDKDDYYNEVIDKVIELRQADHLITAFCYVIQRLVVDHLHVVGDIYDRGPDPDKIMERLMTHHSVDIQWGNHDILWMGAVCGSKVCIANLLRICARYDNLDIVEDVYGINLRPLLTLADKYYGDNPAFRPKSMAGKSKSSTDETLQATKIHQAITMIQFKLEKEIIDRRPEFHMESRLLLENVNFADCTITLKGKTYPLQNTCFALVDPENPCKLSPEEEQVIDKLLFAFQSSEKLLRHVNFLFRNGSLYLVYNNNLLIHGCVPLDDHGKLESMILEGKSYTGPDLLDCFEYHVRRSYRKPRITDDFSTDLIWYLWSGAKSSLFGKREMTTFERYFIEEKETHKEIMNPYYQLRDKEEVCNYILSSFGIDAKKGHIVNGHTPVREIKGESPIKGNGKTIVIDGGYSRVYQKETGIGGYTLLYNSYGMELAAHQPFTSREDAIRNGTDIISSRRVVDEEIRRQKIRETNIGELLCSRSADLHELLEYTHSRRKFQK